VEKRKKAGTKGLLTVKGTISREKRPRAQRPNRMHGSQFSDEEEKIMLF
jgi:hypothetical protein